MADVIYLLVVSILDLVVLIYLKNLEGGIIFIIFLIISLFAFFRFLYKIKEIISNSIFNHIKDYYNIKLQESNKKSIQNIKKQYNRKMKKLEPFDDEQKSNIEKTISEFLNQIKNTDLLKNKYLFKMLTRQENFKVIFKIFLPDKFKINKDSFKNIRVRKPKKNDESQTEETTEDD